jgi:hypothetical protein
MSMLRGRFVSPVPLVTLAIVLGASGCAAGDAPNAESSSSGTPTSIATTEQSSIPSPTATPVTTTPIAEPAPTTTCDTVLTPEEYTALAEDSLVLRDDPQPFDDVMIRMMADGALGCQWAGQGDVMVWFAQQSMDETEWAMRSAELFATGYTESNDPFPGTLLGPSDADPNFIPSVHYADGVMYYASYSRFLNSVLALQ